MTNDESRQILGGRNRSNEARRRAMVTLAEKETRLRAAGIKYRKWANSEFRIEILY